MNHLEYLRVLFQSDDVDNIGNPATTPPSSAESAETLPTKLPTTTHLSFTVSQFLGACEKHNGGPSTRDIGAKLIDQMIDELISKGISPLGWVQANVPNYFLKYSAGLISQAEHDEDPEPSPEPPSNHFGASFSLWLFLTTVMQASRELLKVPSNLGWTPSDDDDDDDSPDVLPDESCYNVYALADMLEELEELGVAPSQYLNGGSMMKCSIMVCLQMVQMPGLHSHIRDGRLLDYLMYALEWCLGHPDREVKKMGASMLWIPAVAKCHIRESRRGRADYYKREAQKKKEMASSFVGSLPRINSSTIEPHQTRCPFCWCDFGTEDVEDSTHDPVEAPCAAKHLFGRSCLVELICQTTIGRKPMCPICRQPWDIDTTTADGASSA